MAKYISGDNRQLVDTALDDGDWAVVDTSEDMSFMRLTAQRKTLLEIDEALRKIAEGTYGICEECGDQISEKRLSILPSASLCINCQEDKERLEAIEKEELR
jgi:DnaK suppressor protein